MPPVKQPYQRIILCGVPYWRDAEGVLYLYESATPPTAEGRIRLGTERDGLDPTWKTAVAPVLAAYRAGAIARTRLTAPATAAALVKT